MIEPTREPGSSSATNPRPVVSDATATRPSSPQIGHSVGRPSQIPRVGMGPMALWLGVPAALAVLIMLFFWLLPTLQSNAEQESTPRIQGTEGPREK